MGTVLSFGTSPQRTLQIAYPETEIHPLVRLVKTENGQRHWREREDPPVQVTASMRHLRWGADPTVQTADRGRSVLR